VRALGSELAGGLECEGFFIHSKGDLAGCGLESGEGEGQSSSRLDPMLMLGGPETSPGPGLVGRPSSVLDDGSVL